MRGLISAALLLAPALAAFVTDADFDQEWNQDNGRPINNGHAFAHIVMPVPFDSRSPDEWQSEALEFRLEVLDSHAACGYGNVTFDGQLLPQTLNGEASEGKGSITTDSMSIVVGSWSFHCIKVNGQPNSQFLKFLIDSVDGNAMKDTGFSVLFRQTSGTEIMNIETDITIPDHIVANPDPEGLRPIGDDLDLPQYSLEDDLAALDYLYAQLRELHYLIAEKERAVAEHGNEDFEDLKDCDSVKCIVKTVADHARNAAHALYSKFRGDEEEHNEEFGHFPKPPFKRPHFRKPHFKKPHWPFHPPKGGKNHTCGPPKHGNHTHGNHTHPPHRKPHFPHHRLPICRYPPPGHHPHHPPPHHPPPHHGPPHGKPPGGSDRWQPGPPKWKHPGGPEGHRPDFHHGPDMDDESHRGPNDAGGPPDHMSPPRPDFDGPPPPPPPRFEDEQELMEFPQPGEKHHRPPPPPGPPPHRRNGLGRALQIVKFTSIGFLFAFLLVALHRRTCTPQKRRDRASRREHREKRRAYRRAVHKHAIAKLLARISGNASDDDDFDDDEEKRQALLSDAEDGMSTTMTEDIEQLRNAANVVGDIVAAEEARSEPITIPVPEDRPLMRDFELGSQVGEGEELPAYEDNDGSEMSSMVADGFRYTPGSSDYSPSHSPSGSVSDILGPDAKN